MKRSLYSNMGIMSIVHGNVLVLPSLQHPSETDGIFKSTWKTRGLCYLVFLCPYFPHSAPCLRLQSNSSLMVGRQVYNFFRKSMPRFVFVVECQCSRKHFTREHSKVNLCHKSHWRLNGYKIDTYSVADTKNLSPRIQAHDLNASGRRIYTAVIDT